MILNEASAEDARRRSAAPVELDLRAGTWLPERLEVAGYYVVAEALTNAAKHAKALIPASRNAVTGSLLAP
jgi:signal transduction histidine kinase